MISQVNMSGKLTGQLTIISEDPFPHYQIELIGFSDNIAYRKAAVHPAIDKILLYDKEKSTTYFQMLEVFLHNERDRVKTAEELYIHKNTLVYRLKKMEQLFEINLDETYEREYLLHSVNCVRALQ